MQYALNDRSVRKEASPGQHGTCPSCRAAVHAKCGEVKIWHWAHVSLDECDSWYEPETVWHRLWKGCFPEDQQEVVIGPHRADVAVNRNTILELQHSSLSVGEAREREQFYGPKNLLWLVDTSGKHFDYCYKTAKGNLVLHWKWAPATWQEREAPVVLHFGDGLYRIVTWHPRRTNWVALKAMSVEELCHTLETDNPETIKKVKKCLKMK